jgi:hypothetical protein
VTNTLLGAMPSCCTLMRYLLPPLLPLLLLLLDAQTAVPTLSAPASFLTAAAKPSMGEETLPAPPSRYFLGFGLLPAACWPSYWPGVPPPATRLWPGPLGDLASVPSGSGQGHSLGETEVVLAHSSLLRLRDG